MKIAGIILAAGASTRLGRSKQTVVLDASTGETLAERAVRVATEAGLAPVIVVVRPESEEGFLLQGRGVVLAFNHQAAEGISSSIRVGIDVALSLEARGAVVLTCDQVGVRAEHLQTLCAEVHKVVGSRYAGRVGVPAYFPASLFEELKKLRGDTGARGLLRDAPSIVDEDLALDVDSEEDLERALAFRKDRH